MVQGSGSQFKVWGLRLHKGLGAAGLLLRNLN